MGKKRLKLKEYNDRYGDIPDIYSDRFIQLWESLKIKASEIPKLQSMIKQIMSIDMKEFKFIFYFIPDATPRARYSGFTKVFYVKNALDYKKIFERFMSECGNIEQISTPCEFYCATYKPTPSAMNRYEKILSELGLIHDISKPDWDNLGKTYSDMVQHGLLMDDAIIYKGLVEKFYSVKPRIEITIRYKVTHESTFNKKRIDKQLKGRNNND